MTPLERFDELKPLIKAVENDEITAMAKFLNDRIKNPECYVTFMGETSSGKSSLINGILNRQLLTVRAFPATGGITEIELCNVQDDEYYLITKDAKIQQIEYEKFSEQTVDPDENIQRIKARVPGKEGGSLKLFDTPGYDSVIEGHEEILKDFLPNSDILIYTVSHQIGIQQNDYEFLSLARNLIRDDVKVLLAINMCPENITPDDRRVVEIQSYLEAILHYKPETVFIKTKAAESADSYPLPDCAELRSHIIRCVNSPERKQLVQDALNGYVDELYERCTALIANRYISAKMDEVQRKLIQTSQANATKRLRNAVTKYIEPAFATLERTVPDKIRKAAANSYTKVSRDIDESHILSVEEMTAFVNIHSIPFSLEMETNEVNAQVESLLDKLNDDLDDYINETLVEFTNDIDLPNFKGVEKSVANLINKLLTEAGVHGLGKYFAAFGGAGGSGAGIANAASHALKELGKKFGHTFSRETHNALKRTLSKIGATSMKFVGVVIAVVLEILGLVIDLAKWKGSLKKKVRKGLDKWEEKTIPMYMENLNELKQENIGIIESIIKERVESLEFNTPPQDAEKLEDLLKMAMETGNRIGVTHNG